MWPRRGRDGTAADRAVWQAASLLLGYPDSGHAARMQTAAELTGHAQGPARGHLERAHAALVGLGPRLAAHYVQTFDLDRHATLYLTYWTAGDTRRRGAAMHEFTATYRESGVDAPRRELPDHLPVVLEFAARVDPLAGRRLLTAHRVPLEAVHTTLRRHDSPYAHVIAAVCATLPAPGEREEQSAQRLAAAGPPTETVGLEPFTLTVPPRRTERVP